MVGISLRTTGSGVVGAEEKASTLPAQELLQAPSSLPASVSPAAAVTVLLTRRLPGHVPRLYRLVRPREHPQRVTWVVDARPEEKTALGPRERLGRALPTTVCWAKERARRGMCSSPNPHFMGRLVPRVRCGRGVMQGVFSPVQRFRSQGFSRRQLNVGKYYTW